MFNFFKKSNRQPKESEDEYLEADLSADEAERYYKEGLATVKDLIAPAALKMYPNHLQVGETFVRTLFVITYPRYLQSGWFSPIINIDIPMNISMFVHPIDSHEVLKQLKKQATRIQSRMHLEQESGKIRDPMLETGIADVEDLRDKLLQGTERFFKFGLYITLYGEDVSDINKKQKFIESLLEAQMIYTKPAVFRMEQGFVTSAPIGKDDLGNGNSMNSSPLSTTFPFVSSDLSSNEGILYGINMHNNSLVLFDRFNMENANSVVFAKSGAGKSYLVKLEVLRSMMMGTEVIVIDPENEYNHLCETVGGASIDITLSSDYRINPFDLPKVGEDEDPEDVFRNTIASIMGLTHIMLGRITPEEDSVLNKAIMETYALKDITPQTDFKNISPNNFPTMQDLYEVLRNMEGGEDLALRMEKYTEGIFAGFLNKHTNINTKNQMVVFNIRDLEEELRPIAMYIVLQYIWNKMRSELKKRLVIVDEAWVMMQHEDAASFMFGIAKRCRKYYTGLTTITQDISDFLASRYGKPIVTNSSIQILLRQSPAAIEIIGDTFYLTDQERFMLLECNVGEGIFFAGTKHVAIKVIASYSEDQIITSDPAQLLEIERAKEELAAQEL